MDLCRDSPVTGSPLFTTRGTDTENVAKKKRARPGPKAERLRIERKWEQAVKKALEKKRPKKGWPGKK